MIPLQRVTGAECVKCGCPGARMTGKRRSWFGKTYLRLECDYCGESWSVRVPNSDGDASQTTAAESLSYR